MNGHSGASSGGDSLHLSVSSVLAAHGLVSEAGGVLGFELPRVGVGRPMDEFRNVILVGMGDPGRACLLARDCLLDSSHIPVVVWQDYRLPEFAGADTLVIVASYSGETLESLSALSVALDRRCTVVVLTSGGPLLESARRAGVLVLHASYLTRQNYYLTAYILILRLLRGPDCDLAVEASLENLILAVPPEGGNVEMPWMRLSRFLKDEASGAVYVVGAGTMSSVATAWQEMFSEWGCVRAFSGSLPALRHGSMRALLPRVDSRGSSLRAILLDSTCLDLSLRREIDSACGLLDSVGAAYVRLSIEIADTVGAQVLGLVGGAIIAEQLEQEVLLAEGASGAFKAYQAAARRG